MSKIAKAVDTNEPDLPERLTFGTHTLPKEFWVSCAKGSNCLNDPAFKARRAAKSVRHAKNAAENAEKQRKGK